MRDYLPLDTANVIAQITNLRTAFPELNDDLELLADTLAGETDWERVLDRLTDAFLDTVSMKGAIADRLAALNERASRFDRKADALRSLTLRLLQASGQRSIPLAEATLSVRNGAKNVVVEDIAELPQGFTKTHTEVVPLKVEIKKALEAGEFVPGAKLVTGPETLAVKTK